jgi:RNA-directed DNA polymerase
MLSNIFLHHVLDKWFEDVVRSRMRGKAILVRFADDFEPAVPAWPEHALD